MTKETYGAPYVVEIGSVYGTTFKSGPHAACPPDCKPNPRGGKSDKRTKGGKSGNGAKGGKNGKAGQGGNGGKGGNSGKGR